MSETSGYPDRTVTGGFCIESSRDELTVAKLRRVSRWRNILFVFILLGILLVNRSIAAWIVLPTIFALLALRIYFTPDHNLQCDRDELKVVDVLHGKTGSILRYERSEVKGIRFGTVAISRYGGTGGLIFDAFGEQVKCLYALKCVEAQKILTELQRLGYDVTTDPGMPMMVEMEQSRRNSWLGRIFFGG